MKSEMLIVLFFLAFVDGCTDSTACKGINIRYPELLLFQSQNACIISTTVLLCFVALTAALIHLNIRTWSAELEQKRLKNMREREYEVTSTYRRELQYSRLFAPRQNQNFKEQPTVMMRVD
ncbi:hypothetical protein M3Y98_00529800 [Aphelenchoides besseyi]|nr:hypothetical protein M3Y98_00529800 [Aphelenchoides besseyi]KAI6208029.1 hypothetical protein M3Y96_00071500 [Aphelenchoides besseyi]